MSFKKILLGIGIVFVVLVGLTFRTYKKEVAKVQANPKQAYTEGLMKDGNLTELHLASYKGDLNKVSQLIQQGYDIHSKTTVFKFTPFHMSIFKGHTKVADFLLSRGAKIDEGSNFNQTPLHWAAFMGELGSVKFLIKKGANLEKLSEHGWTALHYASTTGNLDIVQLLIQKGVQKNRKTSQGQTAKDLAQANKKENVARYLSSVN